jgi:hypothetical protein
MHEYYIDDAAGDLVDVIPLCSDSCLRAYSLENYAGWNGAHESEFTTHCAQCGVVIPGDDACEHQTHNIIVNRFPSDTGERCPHGNWIQVPATYLEGRQ